MAVEQFGHISSARRCHALYGVTDTERDAVCDRLNLNQRPQKCTRLSQRLRTNGCSVDAIGGPTGLSWTLSSNGRSATRVNNVLTPRPPVTAHTRRRLPPSSVPPVWSNFRESSRVSRGYYPLTARP